MNRLVWRLCLVAMAMVTSVGNAAKTVRVALPKGWSLDLPAAWQVSDGMINFPLQTLLDTGQPGAYDASAQVSFLATHQDAARPGALDSEFEIRYFTDTHISQSQVAQLSEEQLAALDRAAREVIAKGLEIEHGRILAWFGTQTRDINGWKVVVSEYRRSPTATRDDSFDIRIVRVFDGGRSFTVTLGYRESGKYSLRPVFDRILASLRSQTSEPADRQATPSPSGTR